MPKKIGELKQQIKKEDPKNDIPSEKLQEGITQEKPALDITRASFSKGVTLPLEPYGGDKFEMLRLDMSIEVRCNGKITVESRDASWDLLDAELNKIVQAEIDELKKRK